MTTSGYSYVLVVADNDYGGLSTAFVPVECLHDTATTMQLGGGYETTSAGTHYDCRISKGSFSGRNAYVNGTNRVSVTKWKVYGIRLP